MGHGTLSMGTAGLLLSSGGLAGAALAEELQLAPESAYKALCSAAWGWYLVGFYIVCKGQK